MVHLVHKITDKRDIENVFVISIHSAIIVSSNNILHIQWPKWLFTHESVFHAYFEVLIGAMKRRNCLRMLCKKNTKDVIII